ncbi:LysE family transporter [Streptomyces sp. NBC_00726]|uniref:LysE/ArgO family amino acid transporter n=1 Tax=Streptomyces sp. NBC_00726 TaxID=2903674 RepID=UPI00386FD393
MSGTLSQLLAGMLLGFGLIMPIGAQNLFIIQQGLSLGYPRVFYATLATTVCDALMISVGALGVGAVFQANHLLRTVLVVAGSLFLFYLAAQNVRSASSVLQPGTDDGTGRWGTVVLRAAAVSLLNPHALLDTIGVLGAMAVTRAGTDRLWFACGAVLASLFWFSVLGGAAVAVRKWLTPRVQRVISWVSSAVMVFFALMLLRQAIPGGW